MKCKSISWDEIDRDFIEVPSNTRIFGAEELGVSDKPLNELTAEVPQRFVLARGSKMYLCNTEGYNYIRYIHRIK